MPAKFAQLGLLFLAFSLLAASSAFGAAATDLIPRTAPQGAHVVVVGTGLDAADLSISFASQSGTIPALVVSQTPMLAEVVVPAGAVSGPVRIYAAGTVLSPFAFSVTPDPQLVRVTTLAASDSNHDRLKQPSGPGVLLPSGDVYVADRAHNQIRLVSASGAVTVIAGTGSVGYVDGPSGNAQFSAPQSVAFDPVRQTLYIADTGNNLIRRLTPDGLVTTLAGSGHPDDIDGTAAAAAFKQPGGLAIDAFGNLYVADTGNDKVKLVTPAGIVTTIAGSAHDGYADGPAAQALFRQPAGIAVGLNGAVYIADTQNNVVRKLENGIVSTVAGNGYAGSVDGSAAVAEFKSPMAVGADDGGTLFVADTGNNTIRKVAIVNGVVTVTTVAGSGKGGLLDGAPPTARFKLPGGIALAGGIYVGDTGNDALRLIYSAVSVSAVYARLGPVTGGNAVRIFGTGFIPGTTTVLFGNLPAPVTTFVSSTEVIVTAPAQPVGTVDVTVSTPVGSATLPAAYSYRPPPTIATVTPNKGRVAGGDTVVITGTGFGDAGNTLVQIGGSPATIVTATSDMSLTVSTPPGSAGPADVAVTTPVSTATKPAAFTYLPPPVITGFLPSQGAAGTTVTITGQNFDPDASGDQVFFGSFAGSVMNAISTQIVAVVPAGAATGRITVATAGGSAMSPSDFVIGFTSLKVTASAASLNVGDAVQFNAIGVSANGASSDATASVIWSSGNPSIASVSPTGIVTGASVGNTSIGASLGGITATLNVNVNSIHIPPAPATVAPPLPSTYAPSLAESISFIYGGVVPIQTGVTDDIIVAQRASLLRGTARGANGAALPGVRVSVVGHPEYGQTYSRADGGYDLVVNGGGSIVLAFEKSGYIASQRQLSPAWADTKVLEDIVLRAYDSVVTPISVSGAASTQVARSGASSDADGTRSATMIIPAGEQATLTLANGTTVSVSSLSVRATELTVGVLGPKSMPAPLPASSAYTYCIELSADEALAAGATGVAFTKPIALYVDNFLNFPVGMAVPAGYYDRSLSQWVPSTNGRVVQIVSVVNGLATLDINGDGVADDASAIGVTAAEQAMLGSTYAAGKTLWRVPVQHFTPWDLNWPFAPPSDATTPNQPHPEQTVPKNDACEIGGHSYISCHNQSLRESIPIVGTPFALEYNSGRVARTQYTATVPLTGATYPSSLKRIDVGVQIAGRVYSASFAPAPNLKWSVTWDGLDGYGRPVQGGVPSVVDIAYIYNPVYQTPGNILQAFATFSGALTRVPARAEIAIHQQALVTFGHLDAGAAKFGHWTLSPQLLYDRPAGVIYEAGGRQRSSTDQGDPRQQFTLQKHFPLGDPCVAAPDGSYYCGRTYIVHTDANGVNTIIAGNYSPNPNPTPDGSPALNHYVDPWDYAVAPDGTLYFIDGRTRIRKIVGGILRTVAGNGTSPPLSGWGATVPTPDGVPATSVPIDAISLAFGPDGLLYFMGGCSTISRIGADGMLTTVAGGGWCPTTFPVPLPAPDGSPAVGAALPAAYQLRISDDGAMHFAEPVYNALQYLVGTLIRRIGSDGILRTVAGTVLDSAGPVADGMPATGGTIRTSEYAIDHDGTVYFGDSGTRVRSVGADGLMTTVAGNGLLNYAVSPDGTLAKAAVVNSAGLVLITPDRRLLFNDNFISTTRITDRILSPVRSNFVPNAEATQAYEFLPQHSRTIDAVTGVVQNTFAYDSANRLISVTDADGQVTQIERNANGDPTAIVAPGGQRTTLTVVNDQLTAIADPMQNTYQFGYGADSLLTSMIDARNGLHKFSYDSQELLQEDDDPAGGSLVLSRSGSQDDFTVSTTSGEGTTNGYRITTTNGDSVRTTTGSDGLMVSATLGSNATNSIRLPDGTTIQSNDVPDPRFRMMAPFAGSTAVQLPSGLTVMTNTQRNITLSNPDDPLSMTYVSNQFGMNGRTWTAAFDVSARTFTTTSPTGRAVSGVLDGQDHLRSLQQPAMAPVSLNYQNGLVTSVTQGPRQMILTYNSARLVSSITDPLSRTIRFNYDNAGRLLTQTMPDGRWISYGYDAAGNVTSVSPPSRPAHAFTFTPVDLASGYTPPAVPSTGATSYIYNRDQQLTAINRPDGSSVVIGYDVAGRPKALTVGRGTFTYAYDSAGRLQTIVTPENTSLTYTYDGFLLKSVAWSGSLTASVFFTYDADLRVASDSVNGSTIAYGYDDDGLLSRAGALTLAHDPESGFLTGTTLGSISDAWTWNPFAEPVSYAASSSGAQIFAEQLTRDDAGRITSVVESLYGNTRTLQYGYDPDGRLQTVTRNGAPTATYAYDDNGNRLSLATSSGTVPAMYDEQDRLLSYGGAVYAYTAAGELNSRTDTAGTTSYSYDELGNLLGVTLQDGTRIDYVIDGSGRRVARKLNGVLVQQWVYADQLGIVAELDGAGALVSRFVYASKGIVPDYMIRGGTTYRIISDHVGSPRVVVDTGTGLAVEMISYDEFGNVLADTNSGFQPFGFAGGLYDQDTRLLRFGARDYDPQTGRWTAKDPMGFDGGDSGLYTYAYQDPINFVDPTGLASQLCSDTNIRSFLSEKRVEMFDKAANALGITDENMLLAVSAWETYWATSRAAKDDHNLFGVGRAATPAEHKQGKNRVLFNYPSEQDSINDWSTRYGNDVRGTTNINDLVKGLQNRKGGAYNTADKRWAAGVKTRYRQIEEFECDCP